MMGYEVYVDLPDDSEDRSARLDRAHDLLAFLDSDTLGDVHRASRRDGPSDLGHVPRLSQADGEGAEATSASDGCAGQ
jgi:hypothetical protein